MREGCCLNLENYRMDGRVDNYKDHKKYLSYKETNKIIFFYFQLMFIFQMRKVLLSEFDIKEDF